MENMKKLLLLSILALLGMTQLAAQDDYEYVPFVREGVKWVYSYTNVDEMDQPADPNLAYGTVYLTLEIKGDTVINGKTYKAMHKYYGDAINAVNDTIPVYLREEDKVVYGIVPDGKTYPDCPIGQAFGNSILQNQIRNGEEFVLYDFQDPQAYWHSFFTPEELEYYEGEFDVQSITFMNIGARMTKCYNFPGFRMIEGIGMDGCTDPWFPWYGYTLFPLKPTYGPGFVTYKIRYVTEGDEIIYKSVNFEGPKPDQDGYEYVPFVREGVKWVYSYTNVDDWGGRTAKPYLAYGTVYLTLELKGDTVINGKTYKAMHKYYGDAINTDNDTIPIYLREEDKVVYGIVPDGKTYPDCPIGQAFAENYIRNQIKKGEEFVLYDFQDPQAYWHSIFSFQEDPMDGLFDVQSITYINIGARITKCYNFPGFCMIEGIGMDAYEFSGYAGYTLFPWQPSGDGFPSFRIRYVVEDGEIIYKGLNYEGEKPDPDDYEYVPFVREGVKWVCDNPYIESMALHHSYFTLELKGDTVINGKTYKAMHKYYGDAINTVNDTIPVYLREQDKVVYGIVPDGKTYPDCPVGMNRWPEVLEAIQNGEEFILYDFNDPINFIKNNIKQPIEGSPGGYQVNAVISDQIMVSGKKVNRYIFDSSCIIEGIGCDGGYPLAALRGNLCHVIEKGDTIYTSKRLEEKAWDEDDIVLPIPRQGVQWVNERVIVDNGDTTQYYYKYEFKGCDTQGFAYCYYYTGETLGSSDATLAAKYQCWEYAHDSSNGMIRDNIPFEKVKSEGRDMVNYAAFLDFLEMYHFDKYATDIESGYTPNWYIYRQKDNFLSRKNLVEVEPLIIQGVECERFAYIGEQGDTLAYIVQGIGFDSRDMGDLLTPFTRQPDPDADHQEWCGLSHVVKDGKIIYKGMRYREGASDGINEVVADGTRRPADPHYYNLMGQPVGTTVPTTPGIYIHQGRKVVVR